MTDPEFTQFATALFSAFPHISAWIKTNSPEPLATQAVWRRTLLPCNYDECLLVVNDWIEGHSDPPTQYELHRTALQIRESVLNSRDRETKRREQDRRTETYEQRKWLVERRRAGYAALPQTGSMMAAVEAGKAVMARHRAGEISLLEANRMVDQIVKGVE